MQPAFFFLSLGLHVKLNTTRARVRNERFGVIRVIIDAVRYIASEPDG